MSRLRLLTRDLGALIIRVLTSFRPEPGTTEGAITLGLILVAAAFFAAGLAPLALGIPGAVLVAIGLGFHLRRPG